MKFLNINATINVKPQFDGEVLKAGTPLDVSGAIANSDAAVGLVANDTAKGAESIAIVTEGTIDLTEIAASYGEALSDECVAALKGITFLYGGKAVVPSGGANRFVVKLTPTAEDFSGTMDTTVAEIYAALWQGKDIWFQVAALGWEENSRVAEVNFQDGYGYPSFNVYTLMGPDITGSGFALLQVGTGATNDGTLNTYFTNIIPLTSGSVGDTVEDGEL